MDIRKLLQDPRFKWEARGEPDPGALEGFLADAPDNLPVKYVRFLRFTGGGRGPMPFGSGSLEIWAVPEIAQHNAQHELADKLPGFFAFGSDGAGQLLVFDLRQPDGASVHLVPESDPSAANLERVTDSFSELLDSTTVVTRHF